MARAQAIVDLHVMCQGQKPSSIWMVALWLLLIGAGFGTLLVYEFSGGENAVAAPRLWPERSSLTQTSGVFNLVMFAHPRCPCTRASIGELAVLMAQCGSRLAAHVLFLAPRNAPDGWEKTDLWQSAELIPGVETLSDPDGEEAARFRVVVSGQTLLYDRDGRLVFEGGITASRGHSGDNEGRFAIASLVSGEIKIAASTPVFGCSLREPEPVTESRSNHGKTN